MKTFSGNPLISNGRGIKTCPNPRRRANPTRPGERVKTNQAIEDAETRLARLKQQIAELVTSWTMTPVIEAHQAMRGVTFLRAVTFVAEIGDVRASKATLHAAVQGRRALAEDHRRAMRLAACRS